MSIYSLASLLASASCLSVGLFVFLKHPQKTLNWSFALITACAGIWTAFPFVASLPEEQAVALQLTRAIYLFAAFVPTTFYYFVLVFLDAHRSQNERRLVAGMVACSALFALAASSSTFITDIVRHDTLYTVQPGPLYVPFVLFFAVGCGRAFYLTYLAFQTSAGARRNQLKYVLTSFAFAYTAGFMHFLGAYTGIEPFPHDVLLIAFASLISYAIARHRLMDISIMLNKGLAYGLLIGMILVPTYLAAVLSARATIYSIPPLLVGSLVFAVGLWVLMQNPRSTQNLAFAGLCAAICTWLLCFFLVYSSKESAHAMFWGKILLIGVVFIPAFFYHYLLAVIDQARSNHLIPAFYVTSAAFVALLPTDLLVAGQHSYFWGFYPRAGVLYPMLIVYVGGVLSLGLFRVRQAYELPLWSSASAAPRIRHLFWTSLIGCSAAIDFTQSYGFEFYPLGYVLIGTWLTLMCYGIVKYQFMDVVVVHATRVAPYAKALGLVVFFYTVILSTIWAFTQTLNYLLAGLIVGISLVMVELLAKLQQQMERAVERALFRKKVDAYQTLSEFSSSLATILDLHSLSKEIVTTLADVMGIRAASLFVFDKEKNVFTIVASHGLDETQLAALRLRPEDTLSHTLAIKPAILLRDELEHALDSRIAQSLLASLRTLQAEVCIPLVNKDRLIGFCNLGVRSDRQMYSQEDLGLLSTLAQNAAIALDNAMLYEELKRSQNIMRRTDRLRSLETIAGGFAHEIRNPLTSIKTFIQLAPDRKDDADFMGYFSKVVSEDVDRIERLIQEILDYARFMEPKLSQEDINDIVASCLYFIEVKAGGKGITIEKDYAADLPSVFVDRQQIKQVLLNLFLNAMDAMSEAGGRLTIRTHRLTKPTGDSWIQIEVTDTGIGIPAENLEHIFDPFYTTKHESVEREGTGLGLTIVHQIVREHRGYIEVTSQAGKGTTFYVNLPCNPVPSDQPHTRVDHEETRPVSR